MSKVFEVELGGKTRRLSYDWASARPFFKKHGSKPFKFLIQDCAGYVLNEKGETTGAISYELVDDDKRVALLTLGLKASEEDVGKWLNMVVIGGGSIADVTWTAVKAAFYAGVTGKSIDLEAAAEKDTATEGKEDVTGTEPPTA